MATSNKSDSAKAASYLAAACLPLVAFLIYRNIIILAPSFLFIAASSWSKHDANRTGRALIIAACATLATVCLLYGFGKSAGGHDRKLEAALVNTTHR